MKIITLNTWAGIAGVEGLIEFFKKHQDTDVFCLQEMMHNGSEWTAWDNRQNKNLLENISSALPDHTSYFRPAEPKGEWGLAIFVKNTIEVEEEGEIFVHLHKESMKDRDPLSVGKNLQWVTLKNLNLTICNVHGLWNGQGKTDTEDRINQSEKIVHNVKKFDTEVVLCGDFNLLPDTQSLKMIEESLDFRNLVKEYNITSTRTSFYTKDVKYADYIFTSKGIEVKDFQVLPDEVSDHSPLLLEIK